MKSAILVDSTGTLSDELLGHPDIYQVLLNVTFSDGEVFADTNDVSKTKRFYQRMEESETVPKTSQPVPGQFIEKFDEFVEKGYDQVFCIFISSKLSGTAQTAKMIAQEYEDKINTYFIDSKGTSFVIENLVIQCQRLLEEGLDGQTTAEKLKWVADRSVIYFMVEDLTNLEKGGRIGKASAALGNLFKIKPILFLDEEGEVDVLDKVRTTKRVFNYWMKLIDEEYEKYNGNIEVAFAHGDTEEEALHLEERAKEKHPDLNYRVGFLTPILGTHGGKGAKGMGISPIAQVD